MARDHANTTRTAAINTFKALLLTAPDQLCEPLRRQSTPRQTAACIQLRINARRRDGFVARVNSESSLWQACVLPSVSVDQSWRNAWAVAQHPAYSAPMPALANRWRGKIAFSANSAVSLDFGAELWVWNVSRWLGRVMEPDLET